MVKFFVSTLVLFLSTNAFTASRYDGYIVKLKSDNNSFLSSFSIKNVEENIVLSSGQYLLVKENNSLVNQIEILKNHPSVEYIEPNFIISGLDHEVPTKNPINIKDEYFKSQWGLRNNGHNNWGNYKAGTDIKMTEGWKLYKQSSNIIIAIVDSGVNYTHADLKDNIWTNTKELNGVAGVDDDGNGLVDDIYGYDFHNGDGDPMDDHKGSHGTHIAGVIGASHNKIGIRGIMPKVKLMSLKFLNKDNKGTTLNAIKSIHYAMDNGAKIINLSWGNHERSQALEDILKVGNKKEVLFVTAAGNSNDNNEVKPIFPASFRLPNIVSVGSFNAKDRKASFSNFSQKLVHVFAPGIYILSTSKLNDKYSWLSGTSQSAPFVSGALGLLLTSGKKLNYLEAKEHLIKTTSQEKRYLDISMGGKLNMEKLLK